MPIKINNVSYTYFKKTKLAFKALNNVSLTIEDGSFTCIVGETGSGKSTLTKLLNGLIKPDEGSINIVDKEITNKKFKDYKDLRKQVGLVFQFPESQLFEETVLKDVCFGLLNFGFSQKEAEIKAKDALKAFGIKEDKFERSPFELSGGERRRVALAGVIALNPKVLVLDEPTVGLDPIGAIDFMRTIRRIHKSGTTVIVVTHDMDMAFACCTNVVMLDKGEVIFSGTREEFFTSSLLDYFTKPLIVNALENLNAHGLNISYKGVHSITTLIEAIKEAQK